MRTVGIPYASWLEPTYKRRACPVCHKVIEETFDRQGEATSNNYGEHYEQEHRA